MFWNNLGLSFYFFLLVPSLYGLNSVPANSYVEVLTFSVTVWKIGCKASMKVKWGNEGGTITWWHWYPSDYYHPFFPIRENWNSILLVAKTKVITLYLNNMFLLCSSTYSIYGSSAYLIISPCSFPLYPKSTRVYSSWYQFTPNHCYFSSRLLQ